VQRVGPGNAPCNNARGMQRVLSFLVFLTLIAENTAEHVYEDRWHTPLRFVYEVLFFKPALIPLFDFVLLGMLFAARRKPGARTGRVKAFDRALWVALGTVVLSCLWGLVRGGDVRQMFHQLHGFLQMLLFSALFLAVYKKRRDFEGLAKAIVAAAIWRGCMVLVFRYVVIPILAITPRPVTMTTHADTVLFVTGFMLVLMNAMEIRTKRAKLWAAFVLPLLLMAIQLNGRRLAWVSLLASLIALYVFMQKGVLKKRITRGMLIAAPVLAIYVAVGMNSDAFIFRPVKSISTMVGEQEDSSSQTRNIENYNLVLTLKQNPILGTGWGHEYREVSIAQSIAEYFPQYKFIPHNSVLGIAAFTGLVGLLGMWMPFALAVFLGCRTYALSKDPSARMGGLAAACIPLIYLLQLYGDMGLVSYSAALIMGAASAAAGRWPILSGVMNRPPAVPEAPPALGAAASPPEAAP
jgi:O-antigen ligase